MRPFLCVLRVGMSALYPGNSMATHDDVLHFLTEAAPHATQRLIDAGIAAAPEDEREHSRAMVELHRGEYARQFQSRVGQDYSKTEDLLQRPNRSLSGIRYAFPLYKVNARGRPRRASGVGWGGARRGAAFVQLRRAGEQQLHGGVGGCTTVTEAERADRQTTNEVTDVGASEVGGATPDNEGTAPSIMCEATTGPPPTPTEPLSTPIHLSSCTQHHNLGRQTTDEVTGVGGADVGGATPYNEGTAPYVICEATTGPPPTPTEPSSTPTHEFDSFVSVIR
ncbi:unnamed protein product [Closterium sp. Yama58-4]|nr:unnamed protein product [Closterium sp. Yama58-4]